MILGIALVRDFCEKGVISIATCFAVNVLWKSLCVDETTERAL